MAGTKQPNQDTGLENLSVNSSRRSGVEEDGTGNPGPLERKARIQPRVQRCRISRFRSSSRQRSTTRRGTRPDQARAAVSR